MPPTSRSQPDSRPHRELNPTTYRSSEGALDKPDNEALSRRKPLRHQVVMFIRRVHLYSGLFMLPWVLLYGSTALLFNHPTVFSGSSTEIIPFGPALADSSESSPASLAAEVVRNARDIVSTLEDVQSIELLADSNPLFTRRAFGTVKLDERDVSVILNVNTGEGYLRSRTRVVEKHDEEPTLKLARGVKVSVPTNTQQVIQSRMLAVLEEQGLRAESVSMRSIPPLEFAALVDGEPSTLRFVPETVRGRGAPADVEAAKDPTTFQGELSLVGADPDTIDARRYLLRLHMAHGYPDRLNTRWLWAIAVDARGPCGVSTNSGGHRWYPGPRQQVIIRPGTW
ncbi:MAG: hypothetical protein AAGF97_17680 [Planctomycetota bacterium]